LKSNKKLFTHIIFSFLIFVFFNPCPATGENAIKVLLLPFEIRSEEDLAFLQKGMEEMLFNKLSENKSVHVITFKDNQLGEALNPADRKLMIKIASELSADYLLTGSLTVFGNSISTQAEFIDPVTGKVLLSFSEISKQRDDVFEHLELLADRIKQEILSPVTAEENRIPAEPVIVKTEKIPQPEKRKSIPGLSWKSQYFQDMILSLSIGNVDGKDGNEVIFCSKNKVFIYQCANQQLVKFHEIETPSQTSIIHADAADINQNGKDEIFVTAISLLNNSPDSFILEWDGSAFQKKLENGEWYFSVCSIPEGKNILLGQKQGRKHPFSPGIYELAWKNETIVSLRKYPLPELTNIYEFIHGNLIDDEKPELITLDERDRLTIYSPEGEKLWSGSDKYGGNETYLEYPSQYDDPRDDSADRYYLQQRLHAIPDPVNKGHFLIVIKNKDRAGRLFSRIRSFESGHVECLAWNGVSMEEKWRTPDVSGYISESAIGDLDNDGKNELICAVVMEEGLFFKKKKSYMSIWKIQN
jgi:TolB-like protein